MPKIRKPKHGGPREGAGRPKKEPTKTLSYRVPKKFAQLIDEDIRKVIKYYMDRIDF